MSMGRLFQMVSLLSVRPMMTAAELAERFEVSERTIYRDIDALSAAGIPVYTIRGRGGGVALLPEYVLDRSLLSSEEQQQILLALQQARLDGQESSQLLDKLSALFGSQTAEWIEVDLSRWGNGHADSAKFAALKEAVLTRCLVTFEYLSADGQWSQRKVKPIKLVFKARAWYLQGYCLKRADYRTFKVDRMHTIHLTDQIFNEPLAPPPIEVQRLQQPMPFLRLRFAKSVAYRVYEEFDPAAISQDDQGALLVEICMPEDSWLYGFLLSFGNQVEVLAPDTLRERLAKQAEAIVQLYAKS